MTNRRRNRDRSIPLAAIILLGCAFGGGCGWSEPVDTTYGRVSGSSINGTGAFAALLKARGCEVGVTDRLHPKLQADVLIRFSPYGDAPPDEEVEWFNNWLVQDYGRSLVYVVNGFDTEKEFWTTIRAALPPDASPATVEGIDWRVEHASDGLMGPGSQSFPTFGGAQADGVKVMPLFRWAEGKGDAEADVEGWWDEEVDVEAPDLPLYRGLALGPNASPLLTSGGQVMAAEMSRGDGRVLVVANGSFLLNEGLVQQGRRPLAGLVADWIGEPPLRVVFVEGYYPVSTLSNTSLFRLLFVQPLTYVIPHLILLGILAVAVRAVRLGRPRAERIADVERPVAHAEALGDLMSRGRDEGEARAQVALYRQWRGAAAPAAPSRGKKYRR